MHTSNELLFTGLSFVIIRLNFIGVKRRCLLAKAKLSYPSADNNSLFLSQGSKSLAKPASLYKFKFNDFRFHAQSRQSHFPNNSTRAKNFCLVQHASYSSLNDGSHIFCLHATARLYRRICRSYPHRNKVVRVYLRVSFRYFIVLGGVVVLSNCVSTLENFMLHVKNLRTRYPLEIDVSLVFLLPVYEWNKTVN